MCFRGNVDELSHRVDFESFIRYILSNEDKVCSAFHISKIKRLTLELCIVFFFLFIFIVKIFLTICNLF